MSDLQMDQLLRRTAFDRLVGWLSPRAELRRLRARVTMELTRRHYEAAQPGRRTEGWRKTSADVNTVIGAATQTVREQARDLVRNNPYAESALSTHGDHVVGYGIQAKPIVRQTQANGRTTDPRAALEEWTRWAETTACDADGRHDFYGLQKLVDRCVFESGECVVRIRRRLPEDGLRVPVQLQVLDPDFLDTSKDTALVPGQGGRQVVQGVEFDAIGKRIAYWIFPEHPGSMRSTFRESQRVPAEGVIHVFRSVRAGQVRGISSFAPTLVRFRDFDEFEDATLVKQKIAACLAVLYTDMDGTAPGVGVEKAGKPMIDYLEPGMVRALEPGAKIEVVDPPQATDYESYSRNQLRSIATGLGMPYEDLTGDYTDMPFSAARMSRLRHQSQIDEWRWRCIIPQFCDPVWQVFFTTAMIALPAVIREVPVAEWIPPPMPMVDPDKEGLAETRNIRSGLKSYQETIRERGRDPMDVLDEIEEFQRELDRRKIILDCDPRNMTGAGQLQGEAAAGLNPAPAPAAPAAADDEEEDAEARARRLRRAIAVRRA